MGTRVCGPLSPGIFLSSSSVESNLTAKANEENKCRDFHEISLGCSEESN